MMVFNFSKSIILDKLISVKLALTALKECENNTDEVREEFTLLIEMGEHILKLIFEPIEKYIDDKRVKSIGLSLKEYDKINEFQHRIMKLFITT